jgi:hypothetical protein
MAARMTATRIAAPSTHESQLMLAVIAGSVSLSPAGDMSGCRFKGRLQSLHLRRASATCQRWTKLDRIKTRECCDSNADRESNWSAHLYT